MENGVDARMISFWSRSAEFAGFVPGRCPQSGRCNQSGGKSTQGWRRARGYRARNTRTKPEIPPDCGKLEQELFFCLSMCCS